MYGGLKKSFIERLNLAQFASNYVRGVGLLFVDSCKDLGILKSLHEFNIHVRITISKFKDEIKI